MSLPELESLTSEQRRILAAEALGWKFSEDGKTCGIGHPDCISVSYALETAIPDPDEDANGALLLVKAAWDCDDRWGFEARKTAKGWEVSFTNLILDAHSIVEPTLSRAITSAFLLASNLAEQ